MRFSAIALIAASALAVNGAAVSSGAINPDAVAIEVETVSFSGKKVGSEIVAAGPEEDDEAVADVAERVVGTSVIVTALGGAAVDVAVGVAINVITPMIQAIIDWTAAREAFTQKTTSEMWKRNPNPSKYRAAVCYNKGYRVKNWNNVAGKAKVTLRSSVLHTNYDCMYLASPNQFWTDAEGGYINLSYTYDRNHCSFDGKTGDLNCW
ncbi:hypothetical protein CPLU01_04370 [Colletotrichum plurivorum]|uniref:DUF7888 domain-containing protein n=1 Tax=Colletotrichum plurivorum TaxID=2175906 RepID=A0A8H6KQC4_9PEZI|nr:hypothetical protein CPLU01_04370 [Colletotrichum plurivorum]